MNYSAQVGSNRFRIEVKENGSGGLELKLDNRPIIIDKYEFEANKSLKLTIGGHTAEIVVEKNQEDYQCWLNSRLIKCEIMDEKSARYGSLAGGEQGSRKGHLLVAPMPGLILKVEVEVGQKVDRGQGLVIMEAMKMENELRSAHGGIVKEIKVKPGQTVDKNQPLILFE